MLARLPSRSWMPELDADAVVEAEAAAAEAWAGGLAGKRTRNLGAGGSGGSIGGCGLVRMLGSR